LISNAIVYYNSAILSRLLERLEAEGNAKGIEALTRISPVAWQHILLNGHYTFIVAMKSWIWMHWLLG